MQIKTASAGKEGRESWHCVGANRSSFNAHIIYKPPVTHLSTSGIILTHLNKKINYFDI